jgi:hypothetical protein
LRELHRDWESLRGCWRFRVSWRFSRGFYTARRGLVHHLAGGSGRDANGDVGRVLARILARTGYGWARKIIDLALVPVLASADGQGRWRAKSSTASWWQPCVQRLKTMPTYVESLSGWTGLWSCFGCCWAAHGLGWPAPAATHWTGKPFSYFFLFCILILISCFEFCFEFRFELFSILQVLLI